MKVGDKLYRYRDVMFEGGVVEIRCETWWVRFTTDYGVYISPFQYNSITKKDCRWMRTHWWPRNRPSKKKFAHPTQKEALESFLRRKERQSAICYHAWQRAEKASSIANGMIKWGLTNDEE